MKLLILITAVICMGIIMLVGCSTPTEPPHEDFPGGGGYFPDAYSNYNKYRCTKISASENPQYVEVDEFGGYEDFGGTECKIWNHFDYDASTNYLSYKIVDDEASLDEGKVWCYGKEKYSFEGDLIESMTYPEHALLLQYPLALQQEWTECDFHNVSPSFFNLSRDLDNDGIDDSMDLKITHRVDKLEDLDLPQIGTFTNCFKIIDTYTLHLYYSQPGFPYPSDYLYTGTSYYKPYVGWVKTELATNFYDENESLTREMFSYYVGGPTKP